MTKKNALEGIATMTIPQLEELHSQMLAQASDLGFQPPEETLVELTDEEQARKVVEDLHKALEKHRDEAGDKPLADDAKKSDTASAGKKETGSKKPAKKAPAKKAAKKSKSTPAAQADNEESTVASKPAKKAAAKKAAKKSATKNARTPAGPKVDENKKINWVFKGDGNGTRPGTGRHERREALRKANGKTVGTYLKAGGQVATLNRAVKEGAVKLA